MAGRMYVRSTLQIVHAHTYVRSGIPYSCQCSVHINLHIQMCILHDVVCSTQCISTGVYTTCVPFTYALLAMQLCIHMIAFVNRNVCAV